MQPQVACAKTQSTVQQQEHQVRLPRDFSCQVFFIFLVDTHSEGALEARSVVVYACASFFTVCTHSEGALEARYVVQ